MKKTIILIPILFVLVFSLLSAQQKTGAFVGISPVHTGKFAVALSAETVSCNAGYTCDDLFPASTETESITSGLGLKAGYNFPNWRVSYNHYTWKIGGDYGRADAQIINDIVKVDYVFNSGFYLGVGLGNGTLKLRNDFSESGSAFAYNLGYDYNIDDSFQVGIAYLVSGFGFTDTYSYASGNYRQDIGIGIATLFLDLTYRF